MLRRMDAVGLLGLATLMAAPAGVAAQLPWESERWIVDADSSAVEEYLGRESILLRGGTAALEGVDLRNGVIEFDLAASHDLGFYGVAFRVADGGAYEHFYLRPFQTGRPDATQYTPVYNGVSGWQIYTGPRHGLPADLPADRWIHVRMTVADTRLEVAVDGRTLVFPALQRPVAAGGVVLTSSGAPARFANVVVTPVDDPPLAGGKGADAPAPPDGLIRRWRVSSPFAESRLDPVADLADAWPGLDWTAAEPDYAGIVNLARHAPRTSEANTVFAATTLDAPSAGPVRLRFGFSDRAVVYLNGRPVYRGNAEWRSRDPRFLGTIGLFDEVILPLERGPNEVRIAVSESFGGWGVIAAVVP
jgi:hypothetical protein